MNVNAEGGGVGAKTGLYAVPILTPDRMEKRQHGRRFKENGEPAFTLTQQDIQGVMIYRHPMNYGKKAVYDTDENYPALRTVQRMPDVANTVDQDGYLRYGERPRNENGKTQLLPIGYRRIRRLTPVECERLQGFPDGWTEGLSDTQRYKCLGNAVTTNVIEYLGARILDRCFQQS